MKKNYFHLGTFFFLITFLFNFSFGQQVTEHVFKQESPHEPCGFNKVHQEKMLNDPEYKLKTDLFNNYVRSGSFVEKSGTVYQIPVVVHIMSTGTALTDITEQQIKDAILHLNERLRKVPGTPGDGNGVDVEIEYALAVRDPNGNCTNGITTVDMTADATYMSMGVESATTSGITDAQLKAYRQWDPTKYYNMWLVSEIDNNGGGAGVQGYAFFASSHGSANDGAVMLANGFKSSTSTTLTHELGHSLNCYHTFEGDGTGSNCPTDAVCGVSGDCCSDTPPHRRSSSDCVSGTNTCTGTARDLFIHNYMDYSSDNCQSEFTADQKTRMQAALTTTRASFLTSDALTPPAAPTADFSVSSSILCGTGLSVTCYDLSSCIPNTYMSLTSWAGISFSWFVTNNAGTTYSSTAQNPIFTLAATGVYDISLTVTSAQGTSTINKQGVVVVSNAATAACTPNSNNVGNFGQTVNNVSFNTINNSTSSLTNIAYTDNSCSQNTVVAAGGTYNLSVALTSSGSGPEVMEAYIDYNNDGDFADAGELVLSGSAANNTSNTVSGNILIPMTATTNTILRMRILGETGTITATERICGANLFVCDVEDYGVFVSANVASVTQVVAPSNTITFGTNTTFTATPVNGGAAPTYQWYLNDVAIGGQTASTFSSTTLLDGDEVYCVMTSNLSGVIASPCTTNVITMTVTGPPISDFTANKLFTCTSSAITFTDQSQLAPTSWSWTFTGGVPATSTAQNPSVTYAAPGTYSVTLTASNGNGAGTTMTKTAYITIYATPPSICASFSRTNTPIAGIGITNVTVNNINKTTAFNDAVFNNFACSDIATLATSTLYNISVTVGSPNSQWVRVFIDYNNDGDFADAGETVFSPANGTGARAGTFTTPAAPIQDQLLRMRVITDFTNTTPGACTTPLEYGQVEDYTVLFQSASCTTPAVSAHPGNTTVCSGTNASYSVTATGTATLTYQWQEDNGGGFVNISNGGIYSNATTSTLNLTGVTNGMNTFQYRCVITNGCGTVNSNGALLTVNATPATPTITPGGATTFCSGGSVTLTSSSAAGNSWSPNGELTQAITANASGNYSVTVTSSGCSATSAATTVTVNANPPTPTITPGGATTFCSGGSVTLTSSAASGNVWAPNGEVTQAITVNATGNYSVTVTSGGCSSTSAVTAVTVNANPPMPTITPSGATTFCSGGSVTLTSSAASGNVWSPNGETTQSISANASGNYSVTVTSGGCSTTSAMTPVVVNSNPVIAIGTITDPTSCGGSDGMIQITGSGFGNLSWTGTSSGTSIGVTLPTVVNSLTAGNYDFTFDNGCISNTISGSLSDPGGPAAPIITPSSSTTFCAGGSVTLTSDVASGIVWSPNGETTQSITVSSAGNYSVTVTSAGCSTTSAITAVTVNANPPMPTITPSGATTFCSGGSVTLTSSAASGNVWSPNGETTQSITANASGNYSVTVTSGGCSTTSAITPVVVNSNPVIAFGTNTDPSSCGGVDGMIQITGSGLGNLSWTGTSGGTSMGVTLPTVVNSFSAGNYNFTFDDGCISNTISTSLSDPGGPTAPIITPSASTTFCAGGSVTLTSDVAGGIVWSPNGETTQSITVNTAGNYSVTVTSAGCSTTSAVTTVTVNPNPPMPIITPSGATTFCSGGSVTLTSDAVSGNVWSPNGETTPSITANTAGNYSVTVTSGGCSTTSAMTSVVVNPNPVISVGALVSPSSCGTSDGMIQILGSGIGNITWAGTSAGSNMGVTLPTFVNSLTAGTYDFTFDDGCLSNIATTTLSDPGLVPTVSADGPTTFCTGGSVTLTSSSASGNVWSPNGETTQSITVNTTGNYSVTVTSGGCVITSAATNITVNSIPATPTISANGSIAFCVGGSVDLTSDAANGNTWSPNGETTSTITVNASGVYSVSVSQNGCTSAPSNQLTVTVNPLPVVTLSPFNAICNTAASFTLNQGSPSGGTYTVNGNVTTVFDPATANLGAGNTIEYTLSDGNGCINSATQTITVNDCISIDETSIRPLLIYPNPSNGIITLSGDQLSDYSQVELHDEIGRIIQTVHVSSTELTFDLATYANGIYFLKLTGSNSEKTIKIELTK